jgi:hypothetical protein
MRVNAGQEFVIGGYTLGGTTFDALVFGYYDGDRLIYAARSRNGKVLGLKLTALDPCDLRAYEHGAVFEILRTILRPYFELVLVSS